MLILRSGSDEKFFVFVLHIDGGSYPCDGTVCPNYVYVALNSLIFCFFRIVI